MDRRQQKTKQAIFQAFGRMLEKKSYHNITVQEIIDEANVGRSTFYAHFETKDELLKAMCTEIFHHVFHEQLLKEETHDFSQKSTGLKDRLTHLLYHLKENQKNISGILSCGSGDLFLQYLKEYLEEMFREYTDAFSLHVPDSFALPFLAGSFSETVLWWFQKEETMLPETVAEYYLNMVNLLEK
ncbi:MAG: TetR/AcrR family transcriptional regulator [Lachnospiraceae bacterium]|nr:TetR/AcrR family transcriptional regulator [Lachnospiraceae bacterium]